MWPAAWLGRRDDTRRALPCELCDGPKVEAATTSSIEFRRTINALCAFPLRFNSSAISTNDWEHTEGKVSHCGRRWVALDDERA